MIVAKNIIREDAALVRSFFDGSSAGRSTNDEISLSLGAYQERDNFIASAFHDLWPFEQIPVISKSNGCHSSMLLQV